MAQAPCAGVMLQHDDGSELEHFLRRTGYVLEMGGDALTEGIVRIASRIQEPTCAVPLHNWVRPAQAPPHAALTNPCLLPRPAWGLPIKGTTPLSCLLVSGSLLATCAQGEAATARRLLCACMQVPLLSQAMLVQSSLLCCGIKWLGLLVSLRKYWAHRWVRRCASSPLPCLHCRPAVAHQGAMPAAFPPALC